MCHFSNGRERIFQGDLPYGLNSSKYLLKEIERGLKILNKNLDGLKFIAVGIGPGSYTGIRMGVITAKTIAFSLKKDLVAFCSLEAFVSSQNEPLRLSLMQRLAGPTF
ncbi:MAG: hypothetical protein HWD61_04415 [Parachlamydiaceae bacterium]|nr:MAG: hypothetical protein HWD61_04415 [Parachlamydiaceae bacterium]